VSSDKNRKLEKTMAELQARWGVGAVRRLGRTAGIPHIPTGFDALDQALGTGGLPRGRITELCGVPTSGMATLALKFLAGVQAMGETAVYLDLEHTFDADYATRCGVQPEQLLLIRPHTAQKGLHILQDFLLSGQNGLLVVDAPFNLLTDPALVTHLATILDRVIAPLGRSAAVLLFQIALPSGNGYPTGHPLPHYAAVRLHIKREDWLYQGGDILGYQAQVLVVKNKFGRPGEQVSLTIPFEDGIGG
jgi:recombination protein RecA